MVSGGLWSRNIFKDSTPLVPLVSIVTVTYNAQQYLAQALDSILNQTYYNIELIVIDGDSKDRTLEIIQERNGKIDFWISEKDKGIYDAMNRGLKLARGKWIGFKNADDWYLPDAVENLVKIGSKNNAEVLYGNSFSVIKEFPLEVSPYFTDHKSLGEKSSIDHRSVFFQTEFHKQIPFDLTYKLAADFDVFCRMKNSGARFVHLNSFISYKRFGGASDNIAILRETFNIKFKFFGLYKALSSTLKSFFSFYFWKVGNLVLKVILGKKYYKFKSRKIPNV